MPYLMVCCMVWRGERYQLQYTKIKTPSIATTKKWYTETNAAAAVKAIVAAAPK